MRVGLRQLKLRCMGCERVGQRMTQEHLFPRWLIDYAPAKKETIRWIDGKRVPPEKATVPICNECNGKLGKELESPVAQIFRAIDAGDQLSDRDCELILRWLWKFEGLAWHLNHFDNPNAVYSPDCTLIERVTSTKFFEDMREGMLLAISRVGANDEGFEDWPLGLDMPPSELSAICASGVFGRIAILCSLAVFEELIPKEFGVYRFKGADPKKREEKLFEVPVGFATASVAVGITMKASIPIWKEHEAWARAGQLLPPGGLLRVRPRVELPPV